MAMMMALKTTPEAEIDKTHGCEDAESVVSASKSAWVIFFGEKFSMIIYAVQCTVEPLYGLSVAY